MLLREIAQGSSPYHFIEVMGCRADVSAAAASRARMWRTSARCARKRFTPKMRASRCARAHQNPDLLKLYETYLGDVGGHLAHELLHTHYIPRGLYNERMQ